MYIIPIKNNKTHFEMSAAQMHQMINQAADPMVMLEASQHSETIRLALEALTEREASVLRERFGIGGEDEKSLAEIAKEMGITRERVRQIEGKALRKLRHPKMQGMIDGTSRRVS